ncbi:MAG: MauE/DoxX family redox-associated membrane protein [Actinomycetota bacterium]
MRHLDRILTWALGLFLLSAGVAKFTTGHVFQYIEHQSGVDIFYPYVNHLTGVAEIIAGALILVPRTRLAGGLLASGVLLGAVAFHLSPWLGVSIPAGLVDGAAAPWGADDFMTSTTSVTFFLAIVTAARALRIVRVGLRERSASPTGPSVAQNVSVEAA